MKAKLLAAEVGAHQAYATKLGADTGLVNVKTREEQALADAQDAAAQHPDALIAAVPAPAESFSGYGPSSGQGYGPQPGIVAPEAQKMHDSQIATLKSLWPVIVRSGNATQVIEALGKGEGLAALSGGLTPGSKPDPNVQRVAGGLYTGAAPTTSTVWSEGDTAGVDAAAREKIAEEAAPKPFQPKDVTYRGQPGIVRLDANGQPVYTGAQGTQQTPDKPDVHDYRGQPGVVTVDANGKPIFTGAQGTAPTPEKPNIVSVKDKPYVITTTPDGRTVGTPVDGVSAPVELRQQGDGWVAIDTSTNIATPVTGAAPQPKIINVDKNSTPTTMQPDGSLKAVPTNIPPEPTPNYQGKTAKDDALNRIVAVQQEARQQTTDHGAGSRAVRNRLQSGLRSDQREDHRPRDRQDNQQSGHALDPGQHADDQRRAWRCPSAPVAAAAFTGQAERESADAGTGPASAVHAATGRFDYKAGQDQADGRAERFHPADHRHQRRRPELRPAVARVHTNFVSPQQRNFAQSVAEYNQSLLYMLSGKAITSDEYKRAMRSYIPLPNDGPEQLSVKAEERHRIIASAVRLGWSNDPDTAKKVGSQRQDAGGHRLGPAGPDGDARRRPTHERRPAEELFGKRGIMEARHA